MPVLPRGASHPERVMLWPYRIDPAAVHPVVHQLDEI
jgi:hypothetical protein